MKQVNKEMQEDMSDIREKTTFFFPNSFGFKFVYQQAIDPDYAERLIEDLK